MNDAPAARPPVETTEDAVLNGQLILRQPRRGHRFGHDAILLAAATGAAPGEQAVDLGAGVGAAGLALAWRVPDLTVTLIEIDPALAALAAENAERNGLGHRVSALTLDATAPRLQLAAAGLKASSLDHVLMNPPFNDPTRAKLSPDPDRRKAHAADPRSLRQWIDSAAWLLPPQRVLTLIWRADRLGDLLASLSSDFGGITILPIHPRPDAPAHRILVRAHRASRGPLALLPGIVLADAAGRPTLEAESVLRSGQKLPLADRAACK